MAVRSTRSATTASYDPCSTRARRCAPAPPPVRCTRSRPDRTRSVSPASSSASAAYASTAASVGGRHELAGHRVQQLTGDPVASRSPVRGAQQVGTPGGRRRAGRGLSGRRLDQRPRESGDEHGVGHVGAHVGHAYLHGRQVRGQPDVPVDLGLVQGGARRDERLDRGAVAGRVPERLGLSGARPAPPHLGAPAGVAGVGTAPQRRVGAHGQQQGQPGPHPVDDRDRLVGTVDVHVDVHATHQRLSGHGPKVAEDPLVPLVACRLRGLLTQRGSRHRHRPRPGGRGRLRHEAPRLPQRDVNLVQVAARWCRGLDLLGEQLLLEPELGVRAAAGAAALVCSQGTGGHRDQPPGVRVDQQQLFLDPDLAQVHARSVPHRCAPRRGGSVPWANPSMPSGPNTSTS